MNYLVSIGLEVHVQLKTDSKMFCGCRTSFGEKPNVNVCPVCLGYPGTMPVMNEKAIRYTVMTGLMTGSSISNYSKFDRKSYFYPDMPKNYQISQYDMPLCVGGSVEIESETGTKSIALRRIHLEEDVAKNLHFTSCSGVDFNRAGTPLMEVVTEPDIVSPDEALAFLLALKQILQYVGASDCNLEEGNLRCDVNCSVRPEGTTTLGTKSEIKNLNTFKGVHDALAYETSRQVQALQNGETIVQDTRRWDADAGETFQMRSKEEAHDYRYFPEPDLMPVALASEQVAAWKKNLPELPGARRKRFVSQYGLPEYDARVLAGDREVADLFERAASFNSDYKSISNWIMTELLRYLSETGKTAASLPLTPEALADLVGLVGAGTVTSTSAKEILGTLLVDGGNPVDIVQARGLVQVNDSQELSRLVLEAVTANPKSVDDYRKGKKAAIQFLVGHVMKQSRGKANPQIVAQLVRERIDAH